MIKTIHGIKVVYCNRCSGYMRKATPKDLKAKKHYCCPECERGHKYRNPAGRKF